MMKTINYKGVDQSGVNCKGFTLVCNFGYYYLACKVEHTPDDPWLGLPVADFFSSAVFGEQFLYSLNPLKNDNDIIGRLFYYLDGEQYQQSNYNQHQHIEFIAQQLQQRNLLIYPLQDKKRLFSNLHFPPPPKVIIPVVKAIQKTIEPDKDCILDLFNIKCSHSKRGFTYDVLKYNEYGYKDDKHSWLDKIRYGVHVVQNYMLHYDVVGEDLITVTHHGACGKGKDSTCPVISVDGPDQHRVERDGVFTFLAKPPLSNPGPIDSLKAFLSLIAGEKSVQSYRIEAQGCNVNQPTVLVWAHDPYGWEGAISLGYSDFHETGKGSWGVTTELSGKIGSQELKIGSIPATKTFNKLIKGIDRVLTEVLNLAPEPQPGHGFEVFNTKFIPPKWVIGGKQELVECKGRPDVGKEGNIYLKFDPLLEVEFTIDIIVVALAMLANSAGAPYLKDMFLDLRAQAQKGYKSENDNLEAQATLKMDFSLFGRLSADLNWQFLPGEPTKSTGGNKATIGMKLKASVDLILKLFIVKVKMGAEIKIVGEDGAEGVGIDFVVTPSPDGHEPGVAIKCDCTGMKIVYAYYGDVMYGGDSVDSSDNANSSWTQMAKKTKASAKYEGSADIFPAFSIFDTGSTENKEKPKNVSLANLKV